MRATFAVTVLTGAVLTLAALPSASLAQEARGGCDREINAVLESVGLNDRNIRRRQVLRQFGSNRRRLVTGLHVWIWPEECDGRFIIDFDRICQVTNTYSTGECSFEGQDYVQ